MGGRKAADVFIRHPVFPDPARPEGDNCAANTRQFSLASEPGHAAMTFASPASASSRPAPPRVLVVGSGAIGSLYGAVLHRAGAEVSVVCRSEVGVVREHGLRIRSPLATNGDLSFRPAQVLARVEDCAEPPDVLLLCTKVLPGVDRAALIRPAVGPRTLIVLIQNGIGIEAEVARAFPEHTVVSVLAFVGVSRVAPGEFEHKAYGALTMGDVPHGASPATRALATLFREGGVPVTVSEQIETERWRKTVWNAAFNPLSVLAGGADTRVLLDTPGGEALLRELMAEVCATAAAAGHALPPELIDQMIANTQAMPPYRNSMALDWLAGHPLELDAILGHLLAVAAERGVPVPRLQTIDTAVRMRLAARG